jgi:hypothetical protein
LGNFERIANVFSGIGPRGMKIHAKDYAHFVKGKEIVEKMESQNEQHHLRMSLPAPPPQAENLGKPQQVARGQSKFGVNNCNSFIRKLGSEYILMILILIELLSIN